MDAIIAIANQKGGVGKSATAVSVAAQLALRGHKTLLIDADPQANATAHFLAYEKVQLSLADVLVEFGAAPSISLAEAVVETALPHLDLVPSSIKFSNFEREPAIAISRLRTHLAPLHSEYQYILIDTPPTLGQILTTALLTATHMLVPVSSHPLAQDGLQYLMHTFQQVCGLNPNLQLLGVVSTMYDTRTAVAVASHELLQERFGALVMDAKIHFNVKIAESPSYHQPIQLYAPHSRGATLYAELTEEILTRLNPRQSPPSAPPRKRKSSSSKLTERAA